MIYKILHEKYLINNRNSVSNENSVFSTLLNFSAELSLNIITIALVLFHQDLLSVNPKEYIVVFLIAPSIFSLLLSFGFLNKKLKEYVNKKEKSNLAYKIINIIYSLTTYFLFFIYIIK